MFGFRDRRTRRHAVIIAHQMLAGEYEFWFDRQPPVNLASEMVRRSFVPKLSTGDRLSPVVHAVEALRYGYAYADLNPDQQAMCAHAFTSLVSVALSPGGAWQLDQVDRYAIGLAASGTPGKLEAAKSKLDLFPEATERLHQFIKAQRKERPTATLEERLASLTKGIEKAGSRT